MPDLRYHLISLISVFLALAIGILLGVAMADRGVPGAVKSDLPDSGANIIKVDPLEPPEPAEITLLENTSPQAMTPLEDKYVGFARDEILGLTGEIEDTPEIVIFVGGGEIPEGAPADTRAALDAAQAEMFAVWL